MTNGELDVAARRLVLAVMTAQGALHDQMLLDAAFDFGKAHLGQTSLVTKKYLWDGVSAPDGEFNSVVSKVAAAMTAAEATSIEASILELRHTWRKLASSGGKRGPTDKEKALLVVVNAAMLALRPMLIACSTRPGSVEETAIRLLASAIGALPIDQFVLADPRAEAREIAAWLVDAGLATVNPDPEPPAVRATPLGRQVALALNRLEEFAGQADEDDEDQPEDVQ